MKINLDDYFLVLIVTANDDMTMNPINFEVMDRHENIKFVKYTIVKKKKNSDEQYKYYDIYTGEKYRLTPPLKNIGDIYISHIVPLNSVFNNDKITFINFFKKCSDLITELNQDFVSKNRNIVKKKIK